MAQGDLVMTPEGFLGYVEVEGDPLRVKDANSETRWLYPKTKPLPVVARRADLEKARAAHTGPPPKEG